MNKTRADLLVETLLKEEGTEILVYAVGGREKSVEVPKGFWRQDRQQLKAHLAKTYPGITWASNGEADPMWAINIYFNK